MAKAKRQDGVPTKGEEKLRKLALDLLSQQIAQKRNDGFWGEFKIKLLFQGGRLAAMEADDKLTFKASNYEE